MGSTPTNQSANNVMLYPKASGVSQEEPDDYKDIFRFGEHDLRIPFEKLDDVKAL